MIGNGDKEKTKQIQEEHVHTLGNLTLTGYNQSLSNFDFIKKRDRTNSSGNSIGYKNGLFLNEDLRDKTKWTREDIEERQIKLSKIAFDLFSR